MDNNLSYGEKLAKYALIAGAVVLVALIAKYFSNVLIYIVLSAVVSLIGQPIMKLLQKIRIKGKTLNKGLLAGFTLFLLVLLILSVLSGLVPVIGNVIADLAAVDKGSLNSIAAPLAQVNTYLINTFSLAPDFRIEAIIYKYVTEFLNVKMFSDLIGSVAGTMANVGIGLFSVIFISFFFIRDEKLFSKIVTSLTPDRLELKTQDALCDVEDLLSRYFVGLVIEMGGVGLLNFLGLWLVARLDIESAVGIAFMTGILNIIPYVGPLMGEVIGTVLAVVLKFCSAQAIGLDVSLLAFALIVFALLFATQLVDMFVYQPLIYSKSIKASPLEIFIVLLVAGTFGGIFGMLAAIPAYTVVRVVAGRFFRDVKFISRLIPQNDEK